jgi:hypothetical protein
MGKHGAFTLAPMPSLITPYFMHVGNVVQVGARIWSTTEIGFRFGIHLEVFSFAFGVTVDIVDREYRADYDEAIARAYENVSRQSQGLPCTHCHCDVGDTCCYCGVVIPSQEIES